MTLRALLPPVALAFASTLCGCGRNLGDSTHIDSTVSGAFTLSSPAFADGADLPDALKCERDGGSGESPPLAWSGAPDETHSFALMMTFWPGENPPPNHYWLLWGIPADTTEIAQGNPDSIGVEGSDKDGVSTGYTPPCSPSADETHTYTITIFALSQDPGLGDEDTLEVDWEILSAAVEDITLDSAQLTAVN